MREGHSWVWPAIACKVKNIVQSVCVGTSIIAFQPSQRGIINRSWMHNAHIYIWGMNVWWYNNNNKKPASNIVLTFSFKVWRPNTSRVPSAVFLGGGRPRKPQVFLLSFPELLLCYFAVVRYLNIGSVIGMDLEDWYGQRMDFWDQIIVNWSKFQNVCLSFQPNPK